MHSSCLSEAFRFLRKPQNKFNLTPTIPTQRRRLLMVVSKNHWWHPAQDLLPVLSSFRALLAIAVLRVLTLAAAPIAVFVRSWNKFGAPGFEEHAGGGRFSKSCSRCVLPTWNRHDGKITTLFSPPMAPVPVLCCCDIAEQCV